MQQPPHLAAIAHGKLSFYVRSKISRIRTKLFSRYARSQPQLARSPGSLSELLSGNWYEFPLLNGSRALVPCLRNYDTTVSLPISLWATTRHSLGKRR